MANAFDQRIVRVGLQLQNGTTTFEGLSIYAQGSIFGSAIMNSCNCTIFNLTNEQKNYVLTEASPLKSPRHAITLTLDVGRESYGTFQLFKGNVLSCAATQPPDIGVVLMSLTQSFLLGAITSVSQAPIASLSTIAQSIANQLGLSLQFHATDRYIDNYAFDGAAIKQVDKLNQVGGIFASITGDTLTVVDSNKGTPGEIFTISDATGMVGIPQITQNGVRVRVMINNAIHLFSKVKVQSSVNPAANGTYIVTNMEYNVASRDQQFWYDLQCVSLGGDGKTNYYLGTLG